MQNSNTKAYYVIDSKLHHLERQYELFRTTAVLNTIPGININIKEIIGNYILHQSGVCLMPVVYQIMLVIENQIWYMQFAIPQMVHGSVRGEIN